MVTTLSSLQGGGQTETVPDLGRVVEDEFRTMEKMGQAMFGNPRDFYPIFDLSVLHEPAEPKQP